MHYLTDHEFMIDIPPSAAHATLSCLQGVRPLNKVAHVGVAALVGYGIRTVIDLRDPRELEKSDDGSSPPVDERRETSRR
jgi:hypothetical protein